MKAFVELVVCTVFSVFDDVFSFFLEVKFAVVVLAGNRDRASWARHDFPIVRTSILTNPN